MSSFKDKRVLIDILLLIVIQSIKDTMSNGKYIRVTVGHSLYLVSNNRGQFFFYFFLWKSLQPIYRTIIHGLYHDKTSKLKCKIRS